MTQENKFIYFEKHNSNNDDNLMFPNWLIIVTKLIDFKLYIINLLSYTYRTISDN